MWRAIACLPVLRDQVNVIAPNRSRASDGLVGDEDHQGTTSDHNPHYVPGVGSEIVTALDLTHDPAGGFDSYAFAEVLRIHRDRRIKYVISNRRIFSSYATSTRPAWAWGPYSGSDPHTNHVHVSALDDPIADTRTPWNLDGFGDDMTPDQYNLLRIVSYRVDAVAQLRTVCVVPTWSTFPGFTEPVKLGLWAAQQTKSDEEVRALVEQTLREVSDDETVDVVLTDEQIAEMTTSVVAGVTTVIPTAQQNAEAAADEIGEREAAADRARADVLDS